MMTGEDLVVDEKDTRRNTDDDIKARSHHQTDIMARRNQDEVATKKKTLILVHDTMARI